MEGGVKREAVGSTCDAFVTLVAEWSDYENPVTWALSGND